MERRDYRGPAVLSHGFRTFFLAGALHAALAVPLWIYVFGSANPTVGGLPGRDWHVHEMIFGYLGAVVGGFLLTAIPNWTGRLPVRGWPLAGLFGLWLAGRVVVLVEAAPPVVVAAVDSAFLLVLAATAAREVVAGKNRKNYPVVGLLTLLALANLGWHVERLAFGSTGYSERLALGLVALLIGLIGGRIIPSFTHNWLAQRGAKAMPAPFATFDKGALGLLGLSLLAWVAAPQAAVTGGLLALAGVAHLARLARWRGPATWREPLVWILHVGYLWLPAALLLLGASVLRPDWVAPTAALHALTAGAMGLMTVAVMTRATLGHTGRARKADTFTVGVYLLILAGALIRVLGPMITPDAYIESITVSGMLWSTGFFLFVLIYGPMLVRARVDEQPAA